MLRNEGEGGGSTQRVDGEGRQHWLTIRVIGTRSNRDGIGARLTLTAGGQRQIREVKLGYSYLCSNDPRVHFGLGTHEKADLVEVRWPSGRVETFRDLPADRFITIKEGSGITQTQVSSR
ncbi:MAG: ASPIC/UnbV domain-containing protein [Candidatus Latescibacteria bacterium]|nr:ASPIC/UnbV domain-containing protein [Candidatus Latescibacterota bacterium]